MFRRPIYNHQRSGTPIYLVFVGSPLQPSSIRHSPTTAYHPQANGLLERFHRRLKDALRSRAAGPAWAAHLPWVMLGIRTAWREEGYLSPAEAVFGSQPLLPGQFLDTPEPPTTQFLQDFRNLLANHRPPPTSHHSRPAPEVLPEDLQSVPHNPGE